MVEQRIRNAQVGSSNLPDGSVLDSESVCMQTDFCILPSPMPPLDMKIDQSR
jgi:hypothetical protein